MNRLRLRYGLFVMVALLQLAAPLYMAWHWEDVLQSGRVYYWQTAPVDPFDAFKGRYVDLWFRDATGPVGGGSPLKPGQTAYAAIREGADRFAYISEVGANKPDRDYVRVRVNYVEGNVAHVTLPFKRYYLPEDLAPAAENAYRTSAGREATVAVRIKDGYGVIEELYIGDKTIYQLLRGK